MNGKRLFGLLAFLGGTLVNNAAAMPVELFVYATDHKRQTILDAEFEIELYQEGNPIALQQSVASKPNCESLRDGQALKCVGKAIVDLPSKTSPAPALGTYRLVFKSHNGAFPVMTSGDIVVDYEKDTRSRILVEPFRLVPIEGRIFENAVQKRSFVPYPKSFTTYGIAKSVVVAALRETYTELTNVRRIGEYDTFLALIDLWKDYHAVDDESLISVIISDVRFENENNLLAALALLDSLGLSMPPTPVPMP